MESAESTRITDEPVVTVTPENGSSVTLTEISPDQAPTETGAGIIDIDPLHPVSPSLCFTQSHKDLMCFLTVSDAQTNSRRRLR